MLSGAEERVLFQQGAGGHLLPEAYLVYAIATTKGQQGDY